MGDYTLSLYKVENYRTKKKKSEKNQILSKIINSNNKNYFVDSVDLQ